MLPLPEAPPAVIVIRTSLVLQAVAEPQVRVMVGCVIDAELKRIASPDTRVTTPAVLTENVVALLPFTTVPRTGEVAGEREMLMPVWAAAGVAIKTMAASPNRSRKRVMRPFGLQGYSVATRADAADKGDARVVSANGGRQYGGRSD